MYAHTPPPLGSCCRVWRNHWKVVSEAQLGCVHGGGAEPLAAVSADSFGAPLAAACTAEVRSKQYGQ